MQLIRGARIPPKGLFAFGAEMLDPDIPGLDMVGVSPTITRLVGPQAAIFLAYARRHHWCSVRTYQSDWWWITKDEMRQESGLTDEMQETARKRLRAVGILEEKRGILKRGASLATIWYRLNTKAIMEILLGTLQDGVKQVASAPITGITPPPITDITPPPITGDVGSRSDSAVPQCITPVHIVPEGTLHADERRGSSDPFKLDVIRLNQDTIDFLNHAQPLGGFPSKIQSKPSKRVERVQKALKALKSGTFIEWAHLSPEWLQEHGLPKQLPPMLERDIDAALKAHREATRQNSRLGVANLAEFFVSFAKDGWAYSPFLRFHVVGFADGARSRVANLRAKFDEKTLFILDRARGMDKSKSQPSESVVLARALLLHEYWEEHGENIRANNATGDASVLSSRGLIRAAVEFVSEEHPSAWIPNIEDGPARARFFAFVQEKHHVNLGSIRAPRTQNGARTIVMPSGSELWARHAGSEAPRSPAHAPEAPPAPLTPEEAKERSRLAVSLIAPDDRAEFEEARRCAQAWNKAHPQFPIKIRENPPNGV